MEVTLPKTGWKSHPTPEDSLEHQDYLENHQILDSWGAAVELILRYYAEPAQHVSLFLSCKIGGLEGDTCLKLTLGVARRSGSEAMSP